MGIVVKLVKSSAGSSQRQKDTLSGLGLGKLQSAKLIKDTSAARGMLRQVRHLVEVETVKDEPTPRRRLKPAKIRRKEAARKNSLAARADVRGGTA